MSKANETATAIDQAPPERGSFDVTPAEFCAGKSQADKRVELIAAFYADEVAAGVAKDSADAFEARFDAFTKRPA